MDSHFALPNHDPTPDEATLLTYYVVKSLQAQIPDMLHGIRILERANADSRLVNLEGRMVKIELWQAGIAAKLVLTTGTIGALIGAIMSQAVGWITRGVP